MLKKKRHALSFSTQEHYFFFIFYELSGTYSKKSAVQKQNGGFLNKLHPNFASYLVLVNKATLLFNKFLLK